MVAFDSRTSRRWVCVAALATAGFLLLATAVWLASGPTAVDERVAAWVLTARTSFLVVLAVAVSAAGAFPAVVSVAVLAAVALWLRTGRLLLPMALLITVAETAAIVYLLKLVVGRERPPAADVLGAPSADASFPSGHTTNGSVVYLLAGLFLASTIARAWLRRLMIVTAVVVSVAIGLTRVYLGYHWVSDVLGGWLLATAICAAAAFAVGRLGGSASSVEPALERQVRS